MDVVLAVVLAWCLLSLGMGLAIGRATRLADARDPLADSNVLDTTARNNGTLTLV